MESSTKFSALLLLVMLLAPQVLACFTCPTPPTKKPPTKPKPPTKTPPTKTPTKTPPTKPPTKTPPTTPGTPPGILPPGILPPGILPPGILPPVIGGSPPKSGGGILPPGILPPVIGGSPPKSGGGILPPGILPPIITPILPPLGTPPKTGKTPPPPKTGGCPTPPPPATCPLDALKLGVCLDVLGQTVNIGDAAVECCPIIEGLVAVSAALCFCTTIKLKVLNNDVLLPLVLKLLVTCGKTPLPGFTCP